MARLRQALIGLVAAAVAAPVVAVPAPPAAAQVAGAPFTCDGEFYGMQNGRQLFRIDFSTAPFTYTQIGEDTPFAFNALGLRTQDGFLYGVVRSESAPGLDDQLVRFDAAGQPTLLGRPVGLPDEAYIAGAFLRDGRYVIAPGAGPVAVVDVTTAPPSVVSLVENTSAPRSMQDFAISPLDGALYGWNARADAQQLARIDPFTGAMSHFGGSPGGTIDGSGSTWFDAFGRLYFYGPPAGVGGQQDTFYRADVGVGGTGPGVVEAVSSGPPTGGSDGASCPFGVAVEKTVEPGTVTAGGVVTYRFVFSNQADVPITADFVDEVDAGRSYVAGSLTTTLGGTANAYGGAAELAVTGLTLPALSTAELAVQVAVPTTAPSGTLLNQAELRNLPGYLPPVVRSDWPGAPGPSDPTPLVVEGQSDLAITKAGPAVVEGGALVTYTLTATNAGPDAAPDVLVTDVLPPGWAFVSADAGGIEAPPGTVTWTLGTLAAGAARILQVTVRAPGDATSGTDHASITSSRPDPDPADNEDSVTTSVTVADVAVVKECPATADPGAAVVQVLRVTNTGSRVAAGTVVRDVLGPGLAFVPGSATAGGEAITPTVEPDTPAPGRATLVFDLGALGVAQAVDIRFEATVPATSAVAGDRTFTDEASATTTTFEADTTDNASGPCTTTVAYRPVLEVGVVPCPATRVVPTGYLDAVLSVANIGSAPAAGASLRALLDAATVVTAEGATVGDGGTTATWDLGTLGLPGTGTDTAARALLARTSAGLGAQVTVTGEASATAAEPDTESVGVPVTNEGAAADASAWGADLRLLGLPLLDRVGGARAFGPGGPAVATGPGSRLEVPLLVQADLVPTEARADLGPRAASGASAALANIRVLGGLLRIDAARATARADAGPFDATTDTIGTALAGVVVNGTPLLDVAPNTTVAIRSPLLPWLVLARAVLREERPTATGIEVNALRVTLLAPLGALPAGTEVTIGHAEAGAVYPSGYACSNEGTTPSTVSGRAAAVTVDADLLGAPLSRVQVGEADLPPLGGADSETVTVDVPGAVSAATATVATSGTTTPTPGAVTTARVEGLDLLGGLVTARLLETAATSAADGTVDGTGTALSTRFVDLVVAGTPAPADVAPGTVLTVPGAGGIVRITLDDRRSTTIGGTDTEGEVAAIRVEVVVAGLVRTEVAVAVAHSDAHWVAP